MTNLEHKNYGASGNEFILHHSIVRPKRLIASIFVTSSLSVLFKLHEMNIQVMWALSLLLVVLLVIRLFNKVSKEVLLVLPSLGVQVCTQYWIGRQETHFFDKSYVKGIIIAEAVTMQSVLCYLALLLKSKPAGPVEKIVPLFTHSWPGVKDLEYVYRTVENSDTGLSENLAPAEEKEAGTLWQQTGPGDTSPTIEAENLGVPDKKHEAVISRRQTRSMKS